MPKKKLVHFKENLTFPHLFQFRHSDLQKEFAIRGNWNKQFFYNQNPLVLELGCGKGEYTIGLAKAYPETNFIGIDVKGARLWRGCKTIAEENLGNAAFIRSQVDHIEKFFDMNEVSGIWITFPDPQPGKERKRLTSPQFLERYKRILKNNGIIHLKTDNLAFFEYTLGVIADSNLKLHWSTDDLYNSGTADDIMMIRTYYESMWLGIGKKICYLRFSFH